VGANGVENYRQKSPKNAVKIAKILLDAGAEVDAVADTYGKGTTLGLVATSIHPRQAGVQIALLETLLDYGSAIDALPDGWSPLISALHNGRPEAAEFLAQRGARLDLEGAAGVGRLDVVESFFNEDGSLKASATKTQMDSGFFWACEYGRTRVVDFLLKKGADLRAGENTGLTGLHWAVVGGQLGTIRMLLERGAPLEVKNVYGGTVLGQALWSAIANRGRSRDSKRFAELVGVCGSLFRGESAHC
jgi:ankyrin repeat protein